MLLRAQNANLAVVQEEWFRVSSHKLSSAHQVEDYLSSINEISHRLLEYIVNLVDSNVSFGKWKRKMTASIRRKRSKLTKIWS